MEETRKHNVCKITKKLMLAKREAGIIVHRAKRNNSGGKIPKGIYICPYCRTYHTTHYAQSHYQRRKAANRRLSAYNRNREIKIRIYDYS